jgi:hypothetical protein
MSVRTSLFLAPLLAVAALSLGCQKKESVDSRDVTTHGMSLKLDVINDGNRSRVDAELHVGSHETSVYARLSDGEQLILTSPDGDKRALSTITSGGKTSYSAEVAPLAGIYTLDFLRVRGAASALGNKIDVPPGFTLTAPPTVSRAEALTFTWDAAPSSGATMSYVLNGDCLTAHAPKQIIGDPGTFTLNAGDLKAYDTKATESCTVKLKVTRARSSDACCSAEFGHPSLARGIQERVITFTSAP